jgi:holo-[acyl-carrier protein] synthase
MVLGIGIDLVEVDRIQSSLEQFGDRFIDRILTPAEAAYCRQYQNPAPHVAVRFAAKESVAKAFGTGIGAELNWRDIEVCRRESGQPTVVLHGAGQALMARRGVQTISISLSHTARYATAVTVLEGIPPPSKEPV